MDDFEIDVLGLDDIQEVDVDESALDVSLDDSFLSKDSPTPQESTPVKVEPTIAITSSPAPSESLPPPKESPSAVPSNDRPLKVQGKQPSERRMIKIPKSTTSTTTTTTTPSTIPVAINKTEGN